MRKPRASAPPGWTILRVRASAWAWHGAALALYALLAAIFIDHGESLTRNISGHGDDPLSFVWFLDWWPWAITHHIDPLFTNLVWQPLGVEIDWVTSVPLLSLAGWPLTRISPVLTYNFFILLGPVLAAFMAYMLCLRITRYPPAAIIGGFLFGFSSYEMSQDTATLNLSFTLCVPALLLIVLLRLDNRLNRLAAILLVGLILICQFLLCIEIFGMIFIFGGIAWALALVYLPERRPSLHRLAVDGLLTAPWVLILLSPFLVHMALHADTVNLPTAWPYYYAADLLNFFIPARTNLFGGGIFALISSHFNGGPQEQDAYLGLPLLLILLLFAWEQGAKPAAGLLLVMFLLLVLFSLGPRLWIAGHYSGLPLPWSPFAQLPLVKDALPTRFALFVSLTAAITAALWIASTYPRQRPLRLALGFLACLVLLPSPHPWMKIPASVFFQPGRVEAALGPQARILVLPFSINGPSAYWQTESHFGFLQTGGYLGFPPKPMQSYPAVGELFGNVQNPDFLTDITHFCTSTRTQFIVVGPGTTPVLQADIARLHWRGQKIDDVVVYTVPAGTASNG